MREIEQLNSSSAVASCYKESESLLRHKEVESQSIHLKDLNDEELSSLSILFGGVGEFFWSHLL